MTLSILEKPREGVADALRAALSLAGRDTRVVTRPESVCPLMVVAPEYEFRPRARYGVCGILLLPDGTACPGIAAREVVTYGMSPRASLTLSAIGETTCVLALQRELVTLGGLVLEQEELEIPADASPERALCLAGAALLLGLTLPGRAYISANISLGRNGNRV
ncbi:MAG: hypothetical protein LBT36_01885 [Oscillospiraceae bacterium]|jgi:hypothetical protein|nr:hypothetical protein [Oscillospiraceae bacterium]